MDGAEALAVPTKLGQELTCEQTSCGSNTIYWYANHQGNPWLQAEIDYNDLHIISTNLKPAADFILRVISVLKELSADKFADNLSYRIETNLEFPPDFGLGSSSTLMNNLACWAGADAFLLNEKCLGGSGYDIAVAQERTAVLYKKTENKRQVTPVVFYPDFADKLIFIHLNKKQNSREGIAHYRNISVKDSFADDFSALTRQVLHCKTLQAFSNLMVLHEEKLSAILELPTVKHRYFPDCPSFVKSLGAWGGDFVLSSVFSGYEDYFHEKGFTTILKWSEIVASPLGDFPNQL